MARPPSPCPTERLLQLLSRPWAAHILWVLEREGRLRFGVLKRTVAGISARLLADRLKLLGEAGIVDRTVRPTVPPEVSYALTDRGRELGHVLRTLNGLAIRWDTVTRDEAPNEGPQDTARLA